MKRALLLVPLAFAGLHEPSNGGPAQSYRLAVTDVYRGAAASTTWVGSAAEGASCGLEGLQPGREYVVFAQERAGGLWASLCGGTATADPAVVAELEAAAGPAHAPVLAPSGSATERLPGATAPASERPWLGPLLGGLALAVVLAAALVVVVRRGRRRDGPSAPSIGVSSPD